MKSFLLATALMVAPAFAGTDYSAQSCSSWFAKIDRNHDGSLSAGEGSEKFLARVTLADQETGGGYIMTRAFFMAGGRNGGADERPWTVGKMVGKWAVKPYKSGSVSVKSYIYQLVTEMATSN